jgi:hypothetical protein
VVDVEQQAVVGLGIFLRKPGTTLMRNLLAEWFFVDNNKIRNIWASMFYPTNDLPVPNWPPYEGNFPVAAEFAAPAAPAAAGPGPRRRQTIRRDGTRSSFSSSGNTPNESGMRIGQPTVRSRKEWRDSQPECAGVCFHPAPIATLDRKVLRHLA